MMHSNVYSFDGFGSSALVDAFNAWARLHNLPFVDDVPPNPEPAQVCPSVYLRVGVEPP